LKIAMLLMAVLIMAYTGQGRAGSRSDVGVNRSAEVDVDLRISIPTVLHLRVGSPGHTIDTVSFNVTDIPEHQPTVRGNYSPMVVIQSNGSRFRNVELTADSFQPLRGTFATMPMSTISWEGTGDFSGSQGRFDGSTHQLVIRFGGRGRWRGTFNFTYTNTYGYPPDSYRGTVTYTLSAP